MARNRVEIEFILKGGESIITTNKELIKELYFANEAYVELNGSIQDVIRETEIYGDTAVIENEKVNTSYQEVMSTYRENVKELNALAGAGQFTSERYKELSASVAQFKANMEEAQRQVNAKKSSVDLSLRSLSGLTGGYSAARGAMALFGTESESLRRTLVQVQGAFALSQGIQQVQEAQGAFARLATIIRTNVVAAFTTLRGAILATGIGALIVGLGLLLANWEKVTTFLGFTKDKQDKLNVTFEETQSQLTKVQESVTKVSDAFDKANQGRITQEEALRTYNETLGGSLGIIDDYNDAEKRFVDATPAFIRANQLRIQSSILLNRLVSLELEKLQAEQEDAALGFWARFRTNFLSLFGTYADADRTVSDIIERNNERVLSNLNSQIEATKELLRTTEIEIANIVADTGIDLDPDDTKRTQDEIDRLNELARQKRFRALQADNRRRIDLLDDGLKKELELIRNRYEEELRIAKENGEDINLVQRQFDRDRLALVRDFSNRYIDDTRALFLRLNELTVGSFTFQLTELKRFQDQVLQERIKFQQNIFDGSRQALIQSGIDQTELDNVIEQYSEIVRIQNEIFRLEREKTAIIDAQPIDARVVLAVNRRINVLKNELRGVNEEIEGIVGVFDDNVINQLNLINNQINTFQKELQTQQRIFDIENENLRIQTQIEGLKAINDIRKELNQEEVDDVINLYRLEFEKLRRERERQIVRLTEVETFDIDFSFNFDLATEELQNLRLEILNIDREIRSLIDGIDIAELSDEERVLLFELDQRQQEIFELTRNLRQNLREAGKEFAFDINISTLADFNIEIDKLTEKINDLKDQQLAFGLDEQDDRLLRFYERSLTQLLQGFDAANAEIISKQQDLIAEYNELADQIQERTEQELRNQIQINNLVIQSNQEKLDSDIDYYNRLFEINSLAFDDYEEYINQKTIIDLLYNEQELQRQIDLVTAKRDLYEEDTENWKLFELQRLELQQQINENSISLNEELNDSNRNTIQILIDDLNRFINEFDTVIRQFVDTINEVGNAVNAILNKNVAEQNKLYDELVNNNNKRRDNEINNYTLTVTERENITRKYALIETQIEEERAEKLKEIEKRRAEVNFAIALASIIANGGVAIIRALAELGPVAGAIAASLIGVQVGAQIVTVTNERDIITKLERGGILEGPSHAEGGIRLTPNVEVEGKEAVINKKSTQKYLPLLSAINEAEGGVKLTNQPLLPSLNNFFELGGIIPQVINNQPTTSPVRMTKQDPVRAYILQSDINNNKIKTDKIIRQSKFLR